MTGTRVGCPAARAVAKPPRPAPEPGQANRQERLEAARADSDTPIYDALFDEHMARKKGQPPRTEPPLVR